MGRRIFVADIGSTRYERGRTPNFGWAGVDPEQPERLFGSSNIDTLAAALATALQAGHHIALGFEAPLEQFAQSMKAMWAESTKA